MMFLQFLTVPFQAHGFPTGEHSMMNRTPRPVERPTKPQGFPLNGSLP